MQHSSETPQRSRTWRLLLAGSLAKPTNFHKNALERCGSVHPPLQHPSQPLASRNICPAEVKRVSSRGQARTQACSSLLTSGTGLSAACVRQSPLLLCLSRSEWEKLCQKFPCVVSTQLHWCCCPPARRDTKGKPRFYLPADAAWLFLFLYCQASTKAGRDAPAWGDSAAPRACPCCRLRQGAEAPASPLPPAPGHSSCLCPQPAGETGVWGRWLSELEHPTLSLSSQPLPGQIAQEWGTGEGP